MRLYKIFLKTGFIFRYIHFSIKRNPLWQPLQYINAVLSLKQINMPIISFNHTFALAPISWKSCPEVVTPGAQPNMGCPGKKLLNSSTTIPTLSFPFIFRYHVTFFSCHQSVFHFVSLWSFFTNFEVLFPHLKKPPSDIRCTRIPLQFKALCQEIWFWIFGKWQSWGYSLPNIS